MAPTATAEKIKGVARDLATFRVEVAERFEKVTERFGAMEKDLHGFRGSVETELRIIRRQAAWLVGGVFGLIAAMITGAATIAWSASAVVSEVKHQGQRLDKIESRLDALQGPPATPVGRPAAKTGV